MPAPADQDGEVCCSSAKACVGCGTADTALGWLGAGVGDMRYELLGVGVGGTEVWPSGIGALADCGVLGAGNAAGAGSTLVADGADEVVLGSNVVG